MLPLELRLKGFQSFEQEEVIDFKKVMRDGLFGIFGITGSGKSSILDGMTMALYGRVNRFSGRGQIQSMLNVNCDKLEVDFTFKVGNNIYRISRKYKKNKKGDLGSPQFLLLRNEEVIADKNKEIAEELNKVIGLEMDDFIRSVVIPQGKFSEFLKLGGLERRSMLERLFNLEEYGKKLQEKVKGEKASFQRELDSLTDQILGKRSGVTEENLTELIKSKEELSLASKKLKVDFGELNTKIKLLEDQKKQIEELKFYQKKAEELKDKRTQVTQVEKALQRAKEGEIIYKIVEIKEELSEKIASLIEEKRELSERLTKNKKEQSLASEVIGKISTDLTKYKEKLKKLGVSGTTYQELERLKTNQREYQGELRKVEELSTSRKKEQLEEVNRENAELEVRLKTLRCELSEKEALLGIKVEQLRKAEEELEELKIKELIIREEAYLKLKKQVEENGHKEIYYLEKLKVLDAEKETLYKEKKKIYTYELQKELQEKGSCPVCGTKTSGNLSELTFDRNLEEVLQKEEELLKVFQETTFAIQKLDLDNLKKEVIKEGRLIEELNIPLKKELFISLEEKLANLQKDSEVLRIETKKQREVIEREDEKHKKLIAEKTRLSVEAEHLQKERAEAEKKLLELKLIMAKNKLTPGTLVSEIERISEKITGAEKIEKEIANLEEKLQKESDSEKKILESYYLINSENERVEVLLEENQRYQEEKAKQLKEALSKSSFEKGDDRVEVKMSLLRESQKIAYENTIRDYQSEVTSVQAVLNNLNERLIGIDFNEKEFLLLKESFQQIQEKISSKEKELGRAEQKIKEAKEELEMIKKLEGQKGLIYKELKDYEELENLFKGNKFVDYLAQNRLKKITREASLKLQKISRGRYKLEVDELGDFIIGDNYQGGIYRSPLTLSGGETFVVSLALALALSNQIQLKGQIQLEFFFLDEGFGTLDQSLLERVLSSLEELHHSEGLKVGIITHIEEIKERIPRQILVTAPISGVSGTKVDII